MGICFSKKKKQQQTLSPPPLGKREEEEKNVVVAVDEEQLATRKETRTAAKTNARRAGAEKKPVFVIAAAAQKLKSTPSVSVASSNSSKEEEEEEEEKAYVEVVENNRESNKEKPAAEVDAILVQCGRLSRSSSHKRYSGSKRSYDFDNNDGSARGGREDDDWEKLPLPTPRPSPRRRTPSRERAGSGGGGSRRVSRSPGRRVSDVPAYSSASDKPRQPQPQQPGKMVSLPAREKGGGTSRRVGAAAAAATSRSNSPAKSASRMVMSENAAAVFHQAQSLSRSNSRKAEQSPLRRNPMAEIDDNSVRPGQSSTNRTQKLGRDDGDEAFRMPSHANNNQRSSDRRSGGGSMDVSKGTKSSGNCVREQLMSCRPKEKLVLPDPPGTVEAATADTEAMLAAFAAAAKISTDQENQNNPRGVARSRRSSKDFDANPAATSSYTSLLLEDIQSYYHQQSAGFVLPACLSKARSILEAVADLNNSSSSSSSSSSGLQNSDNVRLGRAGTFVLESEIVVEDDLTEPSLHKYISGMVEGPQESAGSNSFVGGQTWEPNSVSSTDRLRVDGDGDGEEMVVRGKSSSGGGGGGRGNCSLPVAAAAASATS